eukprot:12386130-Alexandrium_andersonii.AAC.1
MLARNRAKAAITGCHDLWPCFRCVRCRLVFVLLPLRAMLLGLGPPVSLFQPPRAMSDWAWWRLDRAVVRWPRSIDTAAR